MEGIRFKDFEKDLLTNKDIRREYEALKPKYAIIEAIIARRNQLSLSQRQLAGLCGLRQPAICRLERGDNVKVETLFKVTEALDLEIKFNPRTPAEV